MNNLAPDTRALGKVRLAELWHRIGRSFRAFLGPATSEERERRRAHALALLLVVSVAAIKHVTGLTSHSVPFTMYIAVAAVASACGGFGPGLVAALASVLVTGIDGTPPPEIAARLVFVIEAVAVAALVSVGMARIRQLEEELTAGQNAIFDLQRQIRTERKASAAVQESRDREWQAYREDAGRIQEALRWSADEARRQLAALEMLTDPSLNPHGGWDAVADLLERLRSTIGADGLALVRTVGSAPRVLSSVGLPPLVDQDRFPGRSGLAPGRVVLIHNDRAAIDQASTVGWPEGVTSLMIVPVMHDGLVSSTIEVVNERARRATDWDVALVRVVADRLASVVAGVKRATDAVA